MRRRRRPLVRGAMVAGAGYAVAKKSSNTQQREAEQSQQIADLQAQQEQQQYAAAPAPAPAPAPAAVSADDRMDQLVKLKGLLDSGVLSQAEFDAEKARILAS